MKTETLKVGTWTIMVLILVLEAMSPVRASSLPLDMQNATILADESTTCAFATDEVGIKKWMKECDTSTTNLLCYSDGKCGCGIEQRLVDDYGEERSELVQPVLELLRQWKATIDMTYDEKELKCLGRAGSVCTKISVYIPAFGQLMKAECWGPCKSLPSNLPIVGKCGANTAFSSLPVLILGVLWAINSV